MRRISLRSGLLVTVVPTVAYLIAFFVAPIFVFFLYSFWLKQGPTIAHTFTLKNYLQVFSSELYRAVMLRSIWVGLSTGIICVVVSYPLAYAIAFRLKKGKDLVLFALMVTMLSSYLVRIYSLRMVLGGNGLINTIANILGLVEGSRYFLLYSQAGVVVALVSLYLPLTTLPIYSALRNVGIDVIEAAKDLGAGAITAFRRITLPLSAPGVRSAFLFAFILGSSDYVVPQLIGGPRGILIGVSIAGQFGVVDNWPLGSALAFVVIGVYLFTFMLVELILRRAKIYR